MKTLAVLLAILLLAPPAFLIAPQISHAQYSVAVVSDNSSTSLLDLLKDTLTSVSTATSAAANVALQINAYVLQPLAFVLSGNLLKLITASVIAFVIGKTNGTGVPQFVQDIQGDLQRIGDTQASAFFVQFGRNSNSPFAAAINSSLRTNYLQNTSSAGFFGANQSTLVRACPNVDAYLAGNWPQCGVGAWFALTTQTENNPYTLQQAAKSQLASVVSGAQAARTQDLIQGQGFGSWCGTAQTDTTLAGAEEPAAPVDCIKKDGTPGTIKTPGSTIKAQLDKALGATQDKLVQMGSLAKEVNGILGNVATVLSTANFAAQLLGGPNSGGLFGIDQVTVVNQTSPLRQYQSASGFLGVSPSKVYQNASTLPASGPDMLNRAAQYEAAWNTIRSAANGASASLTGLANFCTNAATANPEIAGSATAQAQAAQTANATQVAPVLAQADAAAQTIAAARALVQKVQQELNSGIDPTDSAYLSDLHTLQTMPPTPLDVATIQQETLATRTATAIPAGSLNASGGSIIDRMSIISTNAEALKTAACTESANSSGLDAASTGG